LGNRMIAWQHDALLNDMNGFDEFRKQAVSCNLATKNKDLKKISWCLQNKEGQPQKVVWGDSHAEHLFPGIIKSDKYNNWLLLEQSSCPPLLDVASFENGSEDKCVQANKIIFKTILENPSIDTVVLASLGPFYINNTDYAAQHRMENAASKHILKSEKTTKSNYKTFYDGLNKTVYELKKAGKTVVLFQDIPEIPFMPERCVQRPFAPKKSCFITKEEVMARQIDYVSILQNIKIRQKILLFNAVDIVCNENYCPLMRNHHLIYRDSHHLSVAGSELIAEQFVPWINRTT